MLTYSFLLTRYKPVTLTIFHKPIYIYMVSSIVGVDNLCMLFCLYIATQAHTHYESIVVLVAGSQSSCMKKNGGEPLWNFLVQNGTNYFMGFTLNH